MVLDTHIWVWFHEDNVRLPDSIALEIKRLRSAVAISSISVWEVIMAIQRGRIESSASPTETVRIWLREVPMTVIPVDVEIAVLSRTLEFRHSDPADRFIAATAHHLRMPLATSDQNLLSLPWLSTIF